MDKAQKFKRLFLMSLDNTKPAFIKAALELQKRGFEILYWVAWDKNELANNKLQFKRTQFHLHNDAIKIITKGGLGAATLGTTVEHVLKSEHESDIKDAIAVFKVGVTATSIACLALPHKSHNRFYKNLPEIINSDNDLLLNSQRLIQYN